MLITTDEINTINSLTQFESIKIVNSLNSNLNDMYNTGYLLDNAYNLGYLKATKLIIKFLKTKDKQEKDIILEQLNTFDTYIYDKYSCRARFVCGYKNALKFFSYNIKK